MTDQNSVMFEYIYIYAHAHNIRMAMCALNVIQFCSFYLRQLKLHIQVQKKSLD